MKELVFSSKEILCIKNVLNSISKTPITLKEYINQMSCECVNYDCFFRGVQCTCEGICDGRA